MFEILSFIGNFLAKRTGAIITRIYEISGLALAIHSYPIQKPRHR